MLGMLYNQHVLKVQNNCIFLQLARKGRKAELLGFLTLLYKHQSIPAAPSPQPPPPPAPTPSADPKALPFFLPLMANSWGWGLGAGRAQLELTDALCLLFDLFVSVI